jgi:signal recognition particle receptor subunit beta
VPTGEFSNYLQGTQGFVLIADGTRAGTAQYAIGQWQRAKAVLGVDVPAVLLINKRDLADKWIMSQRVIDKVGQYLPVFITSARTGEWIERAFAHIAETALAESPACIGAQGDLVRDRDMALHSLIDSGPVPGRSPVPVAW